MIALRDLVLVAASLLLLVACGPKDEAASDLEMANLPPGYLPPWLFELPMSFFAETTPPRPEDLDHHQVINHFTNLFEAASGGIAAYKARRVRLNCPRGDRDQLVGPQRTIVAKIYGLWDNQARIMETVVAPLGNCLGTRPVRSQSMGIETLDANVSVARDDGIRIDVQVYGPVAEGFPLLREGSSGNYAYLSNVNNQTVPTVRLWDVPR